MTAQPKTIQIFLPSGDPRGIRIAEITTRIVQVIEVPRSLTGAFLTMPESGQVGIYYLIGGSQEIEPRVYVGQTGELRKRLRQHHADSKKEFWERALVLVSRTNSLTQTHALFLEWYSIQAIKTAGRYKDENGNNGSKPHTPTPLEAECLEIFETGRTLLASLGHPIFDAVASTGSAGDSGEIYVCSGSEADARGLYTEEGFVVLRGSSGRKKNVASSGGPLLNMRAKLLETGVLREEGDRLVFRKDHLFGSPSWAAASVMGRRANGWLEWKTSDGRTLDEVKRQAP
jgi:hypothetical protein